MQFNHSAAERAAKAAHEANAVYSESHGEKKPRWDDLPEDHWMKKSARSMVDDLIADPGARKSAEAQHEAWRTYKEGEGWVLGPTKDESAKTHPSLRPFEELPRSEQLKDALAVRVACAVLDIPAPF